MWLAKKVPLLRIFPRLTNNLMVIIFVDVVVFVCGNDDGMTVFSVEVVLFCVYMVLCIYLFLCQYVCLFYMYY